MLAKIEKVLTAGVSTTLLKDYYGENAYHPRALFSGGVQCRRYKSCLGLTMPKSNFLRKKSKTGATADFKRLKAKVGVVRAVLSQLS